MPALAYTTPLNTPDAAFRRGDLFYYFEEAVYNQINFWEFGVPIAAACITSNSDVAIANLLYSNPNNVGAFASPVSTVNIYPSTPFIGSARPVPGLLSGGTQPNVGRIQGVIDPDTDLDPDLFTPLPYLRMRLYFVPPFVLSATKRGFSSTAGSVAAGAGTNALLYHPVYGRENIRVKANVTSATAVTFNVYVMNGLTSVGATGTPVNPVKVYTYTTSGAANDGFVCTLSASGAAFVKIETVTLVGANAGYVTVEAYD